MSGSWDPKDFPNLSSDTCHITSPRKRKYNCIAWAAGSNAMWWWPDLFGKDYWPSGAPREENIEAFVVAFESQGYELCEDGTLEPGFEKVSLFAKSSYHGMATPTHAAIQLENGHWSSKLGKLEDIEHYELEAVSGPAYGAPVKFLRRKRHENKVTFNT